MEGSPAQRRETPSVIRRMLDLIFKASGGIAVAFLVAIAALTVLQAVFRLFGGMIPSADDFAGFCLAGAVFLGLAHTLRAGAHIRVLVLVTRLRPQARQVAEIVCLLCAVAAVAVLTWYSADMVITTKQLGEYTIGLIPVPKWIPMLAMLVGLAVFLLALLDELVRAARGDLPSYALREQGSDQLSASGE